MKKILYLLVLIILFACNSENRHLVITFENANGLIEGCPVIINDFQIGKVSKMGLTADYKIKAEIELNDTIKLPKDSKFTIGSKDLFTNAIIVTPGKSTYYLSYKDKIIGQQGKSLKLDTIINVIQNGINNSKPVKNQDSIISELHKLNVQIEEIKKK